MLTFGHGDALAAANIHYAERAGVVEHVRSGLQEHAEQRYKAQGRRYQGIKPFDLSAHKVPYGKGCVHKGQPQNGVQVLGIHRRIRQAGKPLDYEGNIPNEIRKHPCRKCGKRFDRKAYKAHGVSADKQYRYRPQAEYIRYRHQERNVAEVYRNKRHGKHRYAKRA